MRKKFPWFEVALSVVVLSAYVYAALSDAYNMPNRWFIRDDAYYYFKVAQNISEGHGSTFDGIHPTNGYHPLWLLICIPVFALARFDLILPLRALVIVTGVIEVATLILLYRLVRGVISAPAAVFAAIYWAFDSSILVFFYRTGVESSIAVFFMLVLLSLAYRLERSWRGSRPGLAQVALPAVVAALMVFSRLDLIFLALMMGLWIVLRGSALRYLLPADVLALVVSCLGAFLFRLGFPGYYDTSEAAVVMLALALLIKVPVLFAFGLYGRPSRLMSGSMLLRAVVAVVASSGALTIAMLLSRALNWIVSFPKPALLYDAIFTLALILLIRIAAFLFGLRANRSKPVSPLDELKSEGRQWLREGAVFYGIVGGSLAIYMTWNKLVFGSFSPVSGQIKRWWGTFVTSTYGGPPQTLLEYFGAMPRGPFNDWTPATGLIATWTNRLLYGRHPIPINPIWQGNLVIVFVLAFTIVILILLWRRHASSQAIAGASLVPLFVGSWLQILSYSATGYASPKEWYWLSQPVFLILIGAWLLNVLNELFLGRWQATRIAMWIAVGAFAIGAGVSYWRDAIVLFPYGQAPANAPYADVVPFLEANTEPGAVIGMTGGGNVGYFLHDRTIVNMDGLINSPEYFSDLKAGSGSDYLYRSGLRYVFANPAILDADPYRGQYVGRLERIASWGGKDLMRFLPGPSG